MSCKGFILGAFLLAGFIAFPCMGSGERILGPNKPDRPSSPAPQKFPRCIEFEKEIYKYENEVKRLQKEIDQEKMDPGASGKKRNIKKSEPKKSKKYQAADYDEIITIDRANPEELAEHYQAIIKDARSELSLALKRRDRDTDPECEHRLDKFKTLIMGKTRYKISPD